MQDLSTCSLFYTKINLTLERKSQQKTSIFYGVFFFCRGRRGWPPRTGKKLSPEVDKIKVIAFL